MGFIERLQGKLIDKFVSVDEKETVSELTTNIKCSKLILPNKDELRSMFTSVVGRDKIIIDISSEGYVNAKYSSLDDLDDFILGINEAIESEDEEYDVSIRIVKSKDKCNNISIYKLETFIDYLTSLTFKGILFELNRVFNNGHIIFRLQSNQAEFFSKSIYFLGENCPVTYKDFDREEILFRRNQVCNFLDASQYKFIPDDFKLIKPSIYNKFNTYMDKLTSMFSLIFIANISSITESNKLKLVMNGYRSITNTIDFNDIKGECIGAYYLIQSWIYNNGNLSDKIGIARNIITIDIQQNSLIDIRQGAYDSIQSAHEIYQRKNIKEYLEVKNKVTEFLFDMAQKTSELANLISKSMVNNLLAIITFFGTIIIMNSFSDKRLTNIFTKDITLISLCLWILSIIYMIVSLFEVFGDKKRFSIQYSRLKNSYNEVLNKDDIENIFKKDSYYKEDIEYIQCRIIRYTIIWCIVLAILAGIIISLGNSVIVNEIQYLQSII